MHNRIDLLFNASNNFDQTAKFLSQILNEQYINIIVTNDIKFLEVLSKQSERSGASSALSISKSNGSITVYTEYAIKSVDLNIKATLYNAFIETIDHQHLRQNKIDKEYMYMYVYAHKNDSNSYTIYTFKEKDIAKVIENLSTNKKKDKRPQENKDYIKDNIILKDFNKYITAAKINKELVDNYFSKTSKKEYIMFMRSKLAKSDKSTIKIRGILDVVIKDDNSKRGHILELKKSLNTEGYIQTIIEAYALKKQKEFREYTIDGRLGLYDLSADLTLIRIYNEAKHKDPLNLIINKTNYMLLKDMYSTLQRKSVDVHVLKKGNKLELAIKDDYENIIDILNDNTVNVINIYTHTGSIPNIEKDSINAAKELISKKTKEKEKRKPYTFNIRADYISEYLLTRILTK